MMPKLHSDAGIRNTFMVVFPLFFFSIDRDSLVFWSDFRCNTAWQSCSTRKGRASFWIEILGKSVFVGHKDFKCSLSASNPSLKSSIVVNVTLDFGFWWLIPFINDFHPRVASIAGVTTTFHCMHYQCFIMGGIIRTISITFPVRHMLLLSLLVPCTLMYPSNKSVPRKVSHFKKALFIWKKNDQTPTAAFNQTQPHSQQKPKQQKRSPWSRISDAPFIYYQGTKTNGVIAILPNHLALLENWGEKVASHAIEHNFVTIWFERETRTAGA